MSTSPPAESVTVELHLETREGLPYDGPWYARVGMNFLESRGGAVRTAVAPGEYLLRGWLPSNAQVTDRHVVRVARDRPRRFALRLNDRLTAIVLRTDCPNATVRGALLRGDGSYSSVRNRRDCGTGIYDVRVKRGDRPVRAEFLFEFERDGNTHVRFAALDLPPLRPGLNDLGRVRTEPTSILASGRVLDTTGNPAPDCLVRGHTPDSWYECADSTSPDGRFTLRGPPTTTLLLQASDIDPSRSSPFARVVTPASDLSLRLFRDARIEGRILFDAHVPPAALEWTITGPDWPAIWVQGVAPDGAYSWDCLPPGPFVVAVALRRGDEPLDRVEATMRAGTDQRLRDLDVRGAIRAIDVRVVDDEHRPVRDAKIRFVDANGVGETTGDDGTARLFVARRDAGPWRVSVRQGTRHTTTSLPGLATIQSIVLPAAPQRSDRRE